MPRPSPALVVAFLALLVSASGVAVAAIPARDGDVHLCYSKKTGEVELVDTQRDRFRCARNWRGFIIDTKPTQLVSPNGQFKVEATNSGARLTGPGGLVVVGASGISVAGDVPVDVTAGTTLNLTGGTDVTTTAGRNLNLTAAGNGGMSAGNDLTVQAAKNLDLLATDRARMRARLALIEGFNEFLVEAKDVRVLASGPVDIFASARMTLKAVQIVMDPPPSG